MTRFTIVGDSELNPNPVDPKISFAPRGCKIPNGSKLEIKPLREVLRACASGIWKDAEKGSHAIQVYKSNYKGDRPYVFDGVIFIDLDKFADNPKLEGKAQEIFDRFEELCSIMPNLLAIKFSPSGNLHVFCYHKDIRDESDYKKQASYYNCALARVIKNVIGLDMRDYDGMLDKHLYNPSQPLNVNDSPVKWNILCTSIVLSNKDKDKLKGEYGKYLNDGRVLSETGTKFIDVDSGNGNGTIVVDRNYNICGLTGYAARTAILSAAYFEFKQDTAKAWDWVRNHFVVDKEFKEQWKSLINNNTIERKYNPSVATILFQDNINTIVIPEDKYLSDVVDFKDIKGKYIYIEAGTGVGKTELVKGLLKEIGNKVIVLQMNKALRDGKQHGIEQYTYGNYKWSDEIDASKVHTTIEGFNRNLASSIEYLEEYVVVVDEAHLLQDYSNISEKFREIIEALKKINDAKQIIFMSATPKYETKIYNFTHYKFHKTKNQTINISGHPLRFTGNGSKEAAKYIYMIDYITKIPGKHIIFSNKTQEKWKKYGLVDMNYTWFHSENFNDEKVQSILMNNRLLTDITLATIYLGVGVEIKHEEEVNIWFDLNEGWDKAFIEQSIGRPRDAKNINLHFFYNGDSVIKDKKISEADLDDFDTALDNLVDENDDGSPTINILAARMTGIYDVNFNSYSNKDQGKILKLGNLINSKNYFNIYDIDLLRQLYYKEINVKHVDPILIDKDGKEVIRRNESRLIDYLCSVEDVWFSQWRGSTYNTILSHTADTWVDKKNARTTLSNAFKIWQYNLGMDRTRIYMGDVQNNNLVKSGNMVDMLKTYCRCKAGKLSTNDFDGSAKIKERLEYEFRLVEAIFTKDYLDYIIYRMENDIPIRRVYEPTPILGVSDDFDQIAILGIDEVESNVSDDNVPYPFRTESWKAAVREVRAERNKMNATKATGVRNSSVKIENIITGEVKEFESKSECRKFLDLSKAAFYKFLEKEGIKKASDWKLID